MAKKNNYDYLLDGKKVGQRTFFNNLKNNSLKKVRSYGSGEFGIDVYDFDKSKYSRYCKMLHGSDKFAPKTLIFKDGSKSQKFSILKK